MGGRLMVGKMRPLFPDFWTDDRTVALSPFARLVFMGLWNFACDNGHLEDRSRQLKRRIIPDDDVNMTALIDEVAHVHELVDDDVDPYITRGDGWITVKGSDRWVVDNRWLKTCDYPGCKELERKTRRSNQGATSGAPGSHRAEVEGEVKVKAAAAAGAAAAADLDPVLDVLRSKLQEHTRLQGLRFDALRPTDAAELVALVETHGDQRLVDVALDTCRNPTPVHVGAFMATWRSLPPPGQRLAAVTTKARCTIHDWITLTPAGICSACASEAIEAKTGDTR